MAEGEDALLLLRREARELWITDSVPRIPWHPTALDFVRHWVSGNTPVVLTGVPIPPWARSPHDLENAAGASVIDVSRTPNGWGDFVKDGTFVKSFRAPQTMSSFLEELRGAVERGADCHTAQGIPYYSAQDDCLRKQLPHLELAGRPDMTFAREAFGAEAEAVNLWVGDSRSVTSMHADSYENMYLVACGEKEFTLLPPTDFPLLDERPYPAATFSREMDCGRFVLDQPAETVAWVTEPQDGACKKVVVKLTAGEMLYLPSLWYHRVRQKGVTIAINFWYDMSFNSPAYVYHQFLRRVTEEVKSRAVQRDKLRD